MLILTLAFRNLLRGGLRTWLNAFVLSLTIVAIIWIQGFNQGILEQTAATLKTTEIGNGQYWSEGYDPYDPLSLQDAHAPIPLQLQKLILQNQATPFLFTQASIYPEGRIHSIILKGIDPNQTLLEIPSHSLTSQEDALPALIGSRMAKSTHLKIGDYVTIRWRDINGTFDAREAVIVQIMNTPVPAIDNRQIWVPLPALQKMLGMHEEATLIVVDKHLTDPPAISNWQFKNVDYLLKDIRELVRIRSIGSLPLYIILLFLSLIAIFDAQVLSIFHRRREIGTIISQGMSHAQAVLLFTLEGALNSVLAIFLGAIYGIPLLFYSASNGFVLYQMTDDMGIALGNVLYPVYSAQLIIGTLVLVWILVNLVSYLPTRKISRMQPIDALRGKLL